MYVCVFVCACIIAAYLTSLQHLKNDMSPCPRKLHEAPPKPQGGLWRESADPADPLWKSPSPGAFGKSGRFPMKNNRLTRRTLAFLVATGMLLFYPVAS